MHAIHHQDPITVKLPVGVRYNKLQYHQDDRGWLTEVHRDQWPDSMRPLQWNASYSRELTLRGFQVHLKRCDCVIVLQGEAFIGLKDLRSQSPTFGLVSTLTLQGGRSGSLTIPPGVGHGLFFPVETLILQSLSEAFDERDDFRCLWNDPELEIPWPVQSPLLSSQDQSASSLQSVLLKLEDQTFFL